VRQPEVARLLTLVLALVLAAPPVLSAGRLLVAAVTLTELLSPLRLPVLSMLTAEVQRDPWPLPGVAADRYQAPALRASVPLVLVHGFAPDGKDDPRLRPAAAVLARAGFDVVVPTIPGLTRGRLRPLDAEPVVKAISALASARARPVAVVAISVGAGPALLAAADPRVRDHVGIAVSIGGYASAAELLRFFLTGDYAWGPTRGHVDHDPQIVAAFVEANADLVDEPTHQALARRDPARISALLAAPPPGLRSVLEALSPERVAGDIRAPLILVHGRGDRAVPYTESLRLAATRPARTSVVLVGVMDHVEGPARFQVSQLRDLLALWLVVYQLSATS
jgi:pimeloyl-ACP methyl ester carboxylesterase